MLIAQLAAIALATLLTTWGASLVLRALAVKLASLRRVPPFTWMFQGASVWDPRPDVIGAPRVAATTLLGLAAMVAGSVCYAARHVLEDGNTPPWGVFVIAAMSGMLWSAALAAALLGFFADRARGRLRCPRCWYDMQGQSRMQCPECGHIAKGQRDLQRTRRSRGMFLLAVVLVLLTAVPDAIWGFRRTGAMGVVPTWAMVLLVDVLPQSWIIQSGVDDDYGTLGDRIDSMQEYQARLAYRFVRTGPRENWQDVISNVVTATTKTNRRALADSSQTLQNLAALDGRELDAMEKRYRQLLENWPSTNSANTSLEQGEVGYLAASLTFLRTDAVRGPNAPRIPTSFVESMVAGPLPSTISTWYLRYVFEARVESPTEVTPIILAAFDRDINNPNQIYMLVQLFGSFISRNHDELPAVNDYLRDPTRRGRGGVLRMWYGDGGRTRPSDELLAQLQTDPDPRVAIAALAVQNSIYLLNGPDPNCDALIAIYNAQPMPDDWCLDQLWRMRCDVNSMTPGLLRDLTSGDGVLAWAIVTKLDQLSPTDPQLLPALKALNSSQATPTQARALAGVIQKLEAANASQSPAMDPAAPSP
ncbi:MAG TPA: hypothetical protein VK157_00855 [Phycisphaerales bacterium]|nr:hypothetical protein [Phycisphaerales bacterium]